MIRINLIPFKAAQKKERMLGQMIVLLLGVGLVFAVAAGVYLTINAKISSVKDEISQKEERLNQLKKAIGEVGRFKKLQEEVRGKIGVLEQLRENKSGPVHLLDELSKSLPDKLWVTSFKEANGAVTIKGIGLNEETVARFMENLESSPYYQKVELLVIEKKSQKDAKLQQFDLTCRVESPSKKPAGP